MSDMRGSENDFPLTYIVFAYKAARSNFALKIAVVDTARMEQKGETASLGGSCRKHA
jgi:hypothetical protein